MWGPEQGRGSVGTGEAEWEQAGFRNGISRRMAPTPEEGRDWSPEEAG